MIEERLKLAVFIDFDNIQIGVKDTLGKEFDVSVVLEALKERGEVVTKVAYGDWPRAGEHSRSMTQHAVQMVQRNVTPRGDKNGADINLALDALEMAFTRDHINAFAIVGGDSDFIALVEKLKQYDKRVFVVGGRSFTSNILQRNCHEFIAYENLLKSSGPPEPARGTRSVRATNRATTESRSLTAAFPNIQRALKILADREVAPQLGPLKSTVLQLDSTFSERDYGAGTFREFMQKMEQAGLVHLRRIDRGYLVEIAEGDSDKTAAPPAVQESPAAEGMELAAEGTGEETTAEAAPLPAQEQVGTPAAALNLLKLALAAAAAKAPNRPLYMRHIRQALRAANKDFDERRYGFRGFLDFLHQGQREGWLRLQRDRKGVWRVFQVAPSAAAPQEAVSSEALAVEEFAAMPGESIQSLAGEEEVLPEPTITEVVAEPEVEAPGPQPAMVEEAAVTAAPGESPAPPKPRKTRAARGTSGRARKTPARRKPKSSDGE